MRTNASEIIHFTVRNENFFAVTLFEVPGGRGSRFLNFFSQRKLLETIWRIEHIVNKKISCHQIYCEMFYSLNFGVFFLRFLDWRREK